MSDGMTEAARLFNPPDEDSPPDWVADGLEARVAQAQDGVKVHWGDVQPTPEIRKALAAMEARSVQVGGNHYAKMKIQPFEYIHANGIGFAEGCVIKYVSRWRAKNGIEDLRKARHFIDLLIEAETKV